MAKRRGKIAKGHEDIFGDDEHVHYLDCGDGFTHVCIRIKKVLMLNMHIF